MFLSPIVQSKPSYQRLIEYGNLLSSHSFLDNDNNLSNAIIFFPFTTPIDLSTFLAPWSSLLLFYRQPQHMLGSSVLTSVVLSSTSNSITSIVTSSCAILGLNRLSFSIVFNSKKNPLPIFSLNPPLVGNLQSIFELFGSLRYRVIEESGFAVERERFIFRERKQKTQQREQGSKGGREREKLGCIKIVIVKCRGQRMNVLKVKHARLTANLPLGNIEVAVNYHTPFNSQDRFSPTLPVFIFSHPLFSFSPCQLLFCKSASTYQFFDIVFFAQ